MNSLRALAIILMPFASKSVRTQISSSDNQTMHEGRSLQNTMRPLGSTLENAHPANFGKRSDHVQFVNLRMFHFGGGDYGKYNSSHNSNWGDLAWVCKSMFESQQYKSFFPSTEGYRFGQMLSVYTVKVKKENLYEDFTPCDRGKCGSLTETSDHTEFGYRMDPSTSRASGCGVGDPGLSDSGNFEPDNYGRDRLGAYRWYSLMTPLKHSNPSSDGWSDAKYEGTVDMASLFPQSDFEDLNTLFPNQKRRASDDISIPTSLDIIALRIKDAIGISWD